MEMPKMVVAQKGRVCIIHDLGININDHDPVDLAQLEKEVVEKSVELKEFLKQGLLIPFEVGMELPKPPEPFLQIPEMRTTTGGGPTSVKIEIIEKEKRFAPSDYEYKSDLSEETISRIGLAEVERLQAKLKEQEELLVEEEELANRKKTYQTQTKAVPVIHTIRVDGAEVNPQAWKAPKSPKLAQIEAENKTLGLDKVIEAKQK